jgi:hypothetical protein
MATLSNAVYYLGGKVETTYQAVGIFDGNKTMAVVRYTFAMGENESASEIKIDMDSGNYTKWRNYASGLWRDFLDEKVWLNFYIGTDPNEFDGVATIPESKATGRVLMRRRSGDAVEENLSWNMTLASLDSSLSSNTVLPAKALLLPGVTYYIWIFPTYTSYGCFNWYDNGAGRFKYTIALGGCAGVVYIGNGADMQPYQFYIANGSSWDLYIPYVGNGTSFDVCS